MAYYVKVKQGVKERFLPSFVTGTKSADGNIILFQSDLNGVAGLTLSDRVNTVGGALLTPDQARMEIDGTIENPAKVYDPKELKKEEEEETATEAPAVEETEAKEEESPVTEETAEEETTEETTEETPAEESETEATEESEETNEESEVSNG